MSILESVRMYLLECPLLRDGRLNVDYLGEEPAQYSVDEVPVSPLLRRYQDGGARKQFLFTLSSREAYGSDALQNLQSHGFYEEVERWIAGQNRRRVLPALDGGRQALTLETTTGGYLLQTDADSARYEMRCRLVYFEKGMNV